MFLRSLKSLQLLVALSLLIGRTSASAIERRQDLVCNVVPTGGDDHDAIIAAMTQCANGGKVRFGKARTYILRTPILSSQYPALSGTEIAIQGKFRIYFGYDYKLMIL
jgi:hypothetical protein